MSEPQYTQLAFDLEIWKPIPGFESLYEVSDKGNVRRLPNTPKCKYGRLLKPRFGKTGYQFTTLYHEGKRGKNAYVHYLVMLAFVGPRPSNNEINHKNGIKHDNSLGNLEYVTRSENTLHAYHILGREAPHGESHTSAKLTEQDVRDIRLLFGVVSIRSIAARYHVNFTSITQIRDGKTWKHVK